MIRPVLETVVRRMGRVRVLVVGDLVADQYVYGQTERISREAPVLIVRHESEEVKLGGAANAAANAAALGARVTALGVLGDDAAGAAMRERFREAGIAVKALRAAATETKTRVLAGGAGTTRQQMLRIDRGAVGPLPDKLRAALRAALKAQLGRHDVVIVSDYGAGVLCEETRAELKSFGRRGLLCVDSRFGLDLVRSATMCKPNEPELAALTDMPVGTGSELIRAGRRALEMLACQTLLVTRGRRGMAVFSKKDGPVFLPVYGPEEAVDVTGAGDTVVATYAVALAAGASALEAAQLSNIAGALKVQKMGTATVGAAELKA
ncbi:MAG: bifunctional hydroxymethylpyrimidine kinase/phosphomethylpyrimidine kinase, partial [Myxococcaceae bacterium]|nr:bifunctional hydroxymethylpyrimidine kinase/phosphomethylpyrimidine kinase [Myxococcaceae bacterium]